jgi:L-fuconolactonase
VDAHQHYWRYDPAEYGWIDDSMAALRRDFLPADVAREMERAGVRQAVAVQARQTLEETRFLLDLADRHLSIAGVVGWVDLRAPDVEAQLDAFHGRRKLVGIRHIVQAEADDRFQLGEAYGRGIDALRARDLAYDILVYPRHLPVVAEFVRRHQGQRFVLDHLAKPEIRRGEREAWARGLRAVAAAPWVYAKLSGLVTEADWRTWTPAQLEPYLEIALDCFGPRRLMIGSDWPVCTVAADYARTMEVVTRFVERLGADDREAVLGGNARRFWRLEGDAS